MTINAIKTILCLSVIGCIMGLEWPAHAKMPAEEAARLNADLTPFGAERSANADGTIPAWDGGLTAIPEQVVYDPAAGKPLADPFAGDKILFSITAENMDNYAEKLSAGQKALLKKYPNSYAIHVYPSRRSFAAPQWVYENTYKNAINAQLTEDGIGVTGAYGGIAFPLPTEGAEVIYNHLTRWHGEDETELDYTIGVYDDGTKLRLAGGIYSTDRLYYQKDKSADNWDGWLKKLMIQFKEPERRKGEIILFFEPLDHSVKAREMWLHVPGNRRVRRAPSIAYDSPNPAYGEVATWDDAEMFNGAIDRFDWKLIGKKEIFVPYHNYQFALAPIDEVLGVNHHNPKYLRWELHRVWVVEATLKPGMRHVYSKRVFYLDEDSWINLLQDKYDHRGNLWRTAVATTVMNYTIPSMPLRAALFYDFYIDNYCANHLVNGLDKATQPKPVDADFFSTKNILKIVKQSK